MDKEQTIETTTEVVEVTEVETTEQVEDTTETKAEETKQEEVKQEVTPDKGQEKSIDEILKEKEKEWQAETDRRVNQALKKKQSELELEINKQLEERMRAVEIREVEAEINSVVKAEGIDMKDLKFIKAESYIGENRDKLKEDLESLKALLTSHQTLPKHSPPGIGREYGAYEAAKKTGNVEAMLKAKIGK